MAKSRIVLYTATYKGKEYTLGVKPWCRLVSRSPTFIYKHLALAKAQGMTPDEAMQYAIEQDTSYGKCGSKKRKPQKLPEQVAAEKRERNEFINKTLFCMGSRHTR